MTLPLSGAISFNNINVELGVSGTTQASLGQTSYRTLAGVASGQISMSNFYGKANQFAFTISTNQTNANLRSLAVAAGWNQSTKVVATIGAGIYVSSNSTGTPALTVNGSFPGGVDLVNNGFIVGMGGNGGNGVNLNVYTPYGGSAGSSGGLALSVSTAVSITNNGTIGGGGGGGGGGGVGATNVGGGCATWTSVGGSGGGGGRTGTTNTSGGSGGVPNGWCANYTGYAGSAGTNSAGGSGGATQAVSNGYAYATGGAGGAGGTWGSAGASGSSGAGNAASSGGTSGGSAGGAVSGNVNITWVATGTRLGSIS